MTIYIALNILIMYIDDVMKNREQTTTILSAIAYLISRQGLSPAEIQGNCHQDSNRARAIMKTVIYALLEIITALAIIGIFAVVYVMMASSPT